MLYSMMSSTDINSVNVAYIRPELSSSYISSDGRMMSGKTPKTSSDLELLIDLAAPKLIGNSYKTGNGKLLRGIVESPIMERYLQQTKGTKPYIDFDVAEKYVNEKITRNKMAELASAYQQDMYNASKLN